MKGVAQNHLGANLYNIFWQHTFYGAIGTDRHKRRRLHLPSGEGHFTTTRFTVGGRDFKLHKTLAGHSGISCAALGL